MDAVIVAHNSAADLRALLASDVTVRSFRRIVVVDNASTDDTREIAGQAGWDLVELGRNRGLAAAANLGVKRTQGPEFALLNPDVRFAAADDLQRLAIHLADPSVGAVAPALELPSGATQDSARRVPSPIDLLRRRLTRGTPDAVRASAAVDVEWAVAACLVLRRTAFDAVGGLDQRYFLYFEDVDLGVRLAHAGFRVRYDPTVRVLHNYRAASRSAVLSSATRHHIRSALRFYRDNPRYVRSNALRRRGG